MSFLIAKHYATTCYHKSASCLYCGFTTLTRGLCWVAHIYSVLCEGFELFGERASFVCEYGPRQDKKRRVLMASFCPGLPLLLLFLLLFAWICLWMEVLSRGLNWSCRDTFSRYKFAPFFSPCYRRVHPFIVPQSTDNRRRSTFVSCHTLCPFSLLGESATIEHWIV